MGQLGKRHPGRRGEDGHFRDQGSVERSVEQGHAVAKGQDTKIRSGKAGRDLLRSDETSPAQATSQSQLLDKGLDPGRVRDIGRVAGTGLPANKQQPGLSGPHPDRR